MMKMLEKYNEIWDKASKFIEKVFISEPVYNDEYSKTKMKFYEAKININFHYNKVPKEDSQYICISVFLIETVFTAGKNYYPQLFFEECKYVVKGKKMPKYFIKDIETSFDKSHKVNFDEENSNQEISDKENHR